MTKKRAHVLVSGIVQGVGYRHYAYRKGNAMGLSGFVRNLPDGRVEAVIEGEESDVRQLLYLLKRGPSSSVVENLDEDWSEFTGEFTGFQVRI